MDTNELMTIQEAAETLGISRAAVYQAIRDGKLPTVSVLGKQVIQRADLTAYTPRTYRDRQGSKPLGRRREQKEGVS